MIIEVDCRLTYDQTMDVEVNDRVWSELISEDDRREYLEDVILDLGRRSRGPMDALDSELSVVEWGEK